MTPGSEEYLDSEKYQYRPRDWAAAEAEGSRWRRTSPGSTGSAASTRPCSWLRNLILPRRPTATIVVWSVAVDGSDDIVIVVVNLDPHGTRETVVHLDLPALGMDWADTFSVHDELTGDTWRWGERNYVRLDPYVEPAHIFTVRRPLPVARQAARARGARQPRGVTRPALVQAGGLLRGPGPRVRRQQRRRHRRLPRPHREARLPAVARRRLPLAAAVLPVAAARRRLRHLRLLRRSCPSSATSATSSSSSTRRTSAACGSSPTSS